MRGGDAWGAHEPWRRAFVDTGVLVAAVDPSNADRRMLARGVLGAGAHRELVTSAQVLSELLVVLPRTVPAIDRAAALMLVRELARSAEVVPITAADVVAVVMITTAAIAEDLSSGEELAFRDALVVRTALAAGCDLLLTRAIAPGRRPDGLVVEDPLA